MGDGSQGWSSHLEPCYQVWSDTDRQQDWILLGTAATSLGVVSPLQDQQEPGNCGTSAAIPIGSNTGGDTPVQDENREEERKVMVPVRRGSDAVKDPGQSTVGMGNMHRIGRTTGREMKELILIDKDRWNNTKNGNAEVNGSKEESQEETTKKLADAKKMITWIGKRVPKDESDANIEALCQRAFRKHGKVGSLMSMRVIVMSMMKGMELQRNEQRSASTMGTQTEGRDVANASIQTELTVRGVERLLMPRDYATGMRRKKLRPEDQRMLDEVIAKTEPEPGSIEGGNTKVMKTATESVKVWNVMADVAIGMDSANNIDF